MNPTVAKDWGLKPRVNRVKDAFLKACTAQGHEVRLTQGLRTIAEQNALYAQGRTKPGPIVTNAKGGQSLHNYGVAFDVVFTKLGYNGDFKALGLIGKSLGLEWGGDWTVFKDKPHFQLTLGYKLRDFEKGTVDWSKFD